MGNKPAPRNWNDVQVTIAASSIAFTLALWNLFAGPDRISAEKHAEELAALPPLQPEQTIVSLMDVQPTMPSNGPILLGGNAPQTQIIIQTQTQKGNGGGGGGRGGNGGGGGGGSPAPATTSTGSS